MPEISKQTQKLIQRYRLWSDSLQPKEGTAAIHVDEVASKVAAFYEKIRGVIDWREEHLLRRAAIERVLKRKFFLRVGEKIDANPVVLELIRAGHFPNDKISESKITEVQKTLDKYIFIIENKPNSSGNKTRMQLQDWLSTIAACEIEEILDPPRKERALIDYMTDLMQERIKVPARLTEEEKNTQIYIAVQRALFKLDSPIIAYHLIRRACPNWSNLQISELEEITKNICILWENINKQLSYPLSEKFYRVCEQMDTPYLILGDILSENPEEAEEKIKNPEYLEGKIRDNYKIRLIRLKSRLARAAFFSTISIFLTKILVAFAIEYPFDKFINQFNPQALLLSIMIPAGFMLLLIVAIRPPSKRNMEKVVLETIKITYENEKKDAYNVKLNGKGGILRSIINFFYSIYSVALFVLLWYALGKLDFSWLSRIIFILFVSLISFAGMKIRERSKELSVEEESGGFFGFLFDWFLPFVRVGKWFSSQWVKYNIVLVLIITLIDLPFQVFVEFIEQWRYLLKEKKEDIH